MLVFHPGINAWATKNPTRLQSEHLPTQSSPMPDPQKLVKITVSSGGSGTELFSEADVGAYRWMLCGALAFAAMSTCAHALAGHCDWQLIAAARGRAGLACSLQRLLAWAGGVRLVFWRPRTLWMRSIAGSISLTCGFYALTRMPVADVLTVTNMFPVWVALLSLALAGTGAGHRSLDRHGLGSGRRRAHSAAAPGRRQPGHDLRGDQFFHPRRHFALLGLHQLPRHRRPRHRRPLLRRFASWFSPRPRGGSFPTTTLRPTPK